MYRFFMRALGMLLVLIVGAIALLTLGPKEPSDATVRFDAAAIGADLDAYLTQSEAQYSDITQGVEKQIVWAGAKGARSEFVVIHVHGYSASSQDMRPVPDDLARDLGANLYLMRLAGHGRGSAALAEPVMNDWVQDMAEAMAIGRALGDKIILTSNSTGGTLSVLAAADSDLRAGIYALAMTAPNFQVANPAARIANWGFARHWVPRLIGKSRTWQAFNAEQEKYWTTTYDNVAILPMMALVKYVDGLEKTKINVPALFMFSPEDSVVSSAKTQQVAAAWGGPKQIELREMIEGEAPSHHVIAGDIMAPSQTAQTVQIMADWVRSLGE